MEKLVGNKVNTAVFISGRGSNLKYLINYSNSKKSLIKIKLIISNNNNALGLKYAKKNQIKYFVIDYKNVYLAETKILNILSKLNIKLICLAGFMKIISKNFIKKFNNPILNIHPSLLPKYKGLNTHKRVLKNKEIFSGSTVHLVTPKLDSGKIILQKKVRISKSDDINKLEKKILNAEHKLYSKAIIKFLSSL